METPHSPSTFSDSGAPNNPVLSVLRKISFHGNGKDLFGIYIVNILLSIVTLGLYYPWAKAAILRYTYGETEFEGSRFNFHGTGNEMFIGMVKAIALLAVIAGVFYLLYYLQLPIFGIFVYFAVILFITPIALVGSLKYRASRSSWRGIHFGYRGTVKEMLLIFIKGFLLSLVTLGFYSPWFIIDIYKHVFSGLRMGNITFKFKGSGTEFFGINMVGYLLLFITLGIYYFKWQSLVHNFIINNIRMEQDGKEGSFQATTSGRGILKLSLVNFAILIFSLGIAVPWVIVRSLRYYMDNAVVKGEIDYNNIQQTEQYNKNATGEGIMDELDISVI